MDLAIRLLKRFYWRSNAVLGYMLLTPVDYLISLTTEQTFAEAHKISMKHIIKIWYKY